MLLLKFLSFVDTLPDTGFAAGDVSIEKTQESESSQLRKKVVPVDTTEKGRQDRCQRCVTTRKRTTFLFWFF